MPVKSRGGKRLRDGLQSAGQVSDEKTNMCKPLLTHRKTITMATHQVLVLTPQAVVTPSIGAVARELHLTPATWPNP